MYINIYIYIFLLLERQLGRWKVCFIFEKRSTVFSISFCLCLNFNCLMVKNYVNTWDVNVAHLRNFLFFPSLCFNLSVYLGKLIFRAWKKWLLSVLFSFYFSRKGALTQVWKYYFFLFNSTNSILIIIDALLRENIYNFREH